jgi:small subunit ribosomal protein S17
MINQANTENTENKHDRTIVAKVVSNSMNKTAVAVVTRKTAHPVYGKFVVRSTKYYVHDEENQLQVGDLIRIKQSRPLSKLKRWVLCEILDKSAA